MVTRRTRGVVIGAAGFALLLPLLCGCGTPPRSPRTPVEATVKSAVPTMIEAVVVDVRSDAGTLTVKDSRDHATWLVSLTEDSRIFGPDRPDVRLDEIEVGDRLRVSGTSRIDLILKAETIELLDREPVR